MKPEDLIGPKAFGLTDAFDEEEFDFMDDACYCCLCGQALTSEEMDQFSTDNVQACMTCREKEGV